MKTVLIIVSDYYCDISFGLFKNSLKFWYEQDSITQEWYDRIRKYSQTKRLININTQEDLVSIGHDYQIWACFVPGCLEIPLAASILYPKMTFDGLVALGCVIEGETSHYEHVCTQTMNGLTNFALNNNIALGNGVLTVLTEEQALARLDKGYEAVVACVELLKLKS